MTHLNEEIARLFFEVNGFLVRTNIPYELGKGSPDSDIDLAIENTHRIAGSPRGAVLTDKEVPKIRRAVVEVKGYHTEKFTPSILEERMFRFATPPATAAAREFFGGKPFKRVFVVSRLPATDTAREESVRCIQGYGVDFIIQFETILRSLTSWVEPDPEYDSDFLAALRLLKNYGYLREDPMAATAGGVLHKAYTYTTKNGRRVHVKAHIEHPRKQTL